MRIIITIFTLLFTAGIAQEGKPIQHCIENRFDFPKKFEARFMEQK